LLALCRHCCCCCCCCSCSCLADAAELSSLLRQCPELLWLDHAAALPAACCCACLAQAADLSCDSHNCDAPLLHSIRSSTGAWPAAKTEKLVRAPVVLSATLAGCRPAEGHHPALVHVRKLLAAARLEPKIQIHPTGRVRGRHGAALTGPVCYTGTLCS
jgi:hypothetical protein